MHLKIIKLFFIIVPLKRYCERFKSFILCIPRIPIIIKFFYNIGRILKKGVLDTLTALIKDGIIDITKADVSMFQKKSLRGGAYDTGNQGINRDY